MRARLGQARQGWASVKQTTNTIANPHSIAFVLGNHCVGWMRRPTAVRRGTKYHKDVLPMYATGSSLTCGVKEGDELVVPDAPALVVCDGIVTRSVNKPNR